MGNLESGKPVEQKKSTSNEEQGESNQHKRRRIGRVTIHDLPVELINEIFVLAKFGNSLPLVNKYFNRILKFDPYSTEENWPNVSLAIKVVRQQFFIPLNALLNFGAISESLRV